MYRVGLRSEEPGLVEIRVSGKGEERAIFIHAEAIDGILRGLKDAAKHIESGTDASDPQLLFL